MEIVSEFLNGAKLLSPSVFKDERGWFFEAYNKKTFANLGINNDFVQDNESYSLCNVLRGLHFQLAPYCQAKLISVVEGEIEDYIVDLRFGSPSFGLYERIVLSSDNKAVLFVPRGFAHGFLTITDYAKISYKCDNYYNSSAESGIKFDDITLNIPWNLGSVSPIISKKDAGLPSFEEYKKNPAFKYE